MDNSEGELRNERPKRHRVRYNIPGHARYLTCSCWGNAAFLKGDRACGWFIRALIAAIEKHSLQLWAWVIMPSHFHIIVVPDPSDPTVSSALSSLKQSVTRRAIYWIRKHAPEFLPRMLDRQPNGDKHLRFWQPGGGHDHNLWSPKQIWEKIDYIHNNPFEAGLVKHVSEWPWSSVHEYLKRGSGPIPIDFKHIPRRP